MCKRLKVDNNVDWPYCDEAKYKNKRFCECKRIGLTKLSVIFELESIKLFNLISSFRGRAIETERRFVWFLKVFIYLYGGVIGFYVLWHDSFMLAYRRWQQHQQHWSDISPIEIFRIDIKAQILGQRITTLCAILLH